MAEDLTEDEQGGFREGRGCVDQIFALNQIGEKARKKKCRVYFGVMGLKKYMIWLIRKHYGRC